MQAGLLRDIIIIDEPTVSRTATGSQETTWSQFWRGRAWVRFSNGGRAVINDEIVNTVTRKVTIRQIPGTSPLMRIRIGSQKYRILSIDESQRDRTITFLTELINE